MYLIRYGGTSEELLIIEFGGAYPPDTLVIPGGSSAWVKFESRGWDTYSGVKFTLELQHVEGIFLCSLDPDSSLCGSRVI